MADAEKTGAPVVRFAPSPTGQLHIGGARTALYNWLLARGSGGRLVLRIEDTDRERSTPENIEQILDALQWLGIDYDGEPVLQSTHAERHSAVIEQLLESGHAYRSNATGESVRAWKEANDGAGFRGEAEGEGAVRLRVPDGKIVIDDLIRGEIEFDSQHLDDPVIARGDGTALYNLAVAVDDLDAGVTHVVRGEDHISNTPKQLLVLDALGAARPRYAHLPLLHGPDGKKLSKRHGAASVQELRDAGYLPDAVCNYLALLGWGLDEDSTFFTAQELQREFTLERVSKSPARFDEQKLRWMNGRYLKELATDDLVAQLQALLVAEGKLAGTEDERIALGAAAPVAAEKMQTLTEFWGLCGYLFSEPEHDPKAASKWLTTDQQPILEAARAALGSIDGEFDVTAVEKALEPLPEQFELKPGKVFQPIRVALTGGTVSPGIYETVSLLGQAKTLERIDAALTSIPDLA